MTALDKFAKMLGIKRDHAEDALYSERAAKVALSRRNLFAAGAALAGGALIYCPEPVIEAAPTLVNFTMRFAVGSWTGEAGISREFTCSFDGESHISLRTG